MQQQEIDRAIWDFLQQRIGNPYGTAGVMGNLFAESALIPNTLENIYKQSLGQTNESYTMGVDNGSYPAESFAGDSAGYGLAQWTYGPRKRGLLEFAKSTGRSIGDLSMQLEYLWKELAEDYGGLVQILQNASSVAEASNAFLTMFEKPADQGKITQIRRANYGRAYLNFFAPGVVDSPTPTEPFVVSIDSPLVNIRSGPGTNNPVVSAFSGAGNFTIVEVAQGEGAEIGWGRLDNGAGWITLDFVTSSQT